MRSGVGERDICTGGDRSNKGDRGGGRGCGSHNNDGITRGLQGGRVRICRCIVPGSSCTGSRSLALTGDVAILVACAANVAARAFTRAAANDSSCCGGGARGGRVIPGAVGAGDSYKVGLGVDGSVPFPVAARSPTARRRRRSRCALSLVIGVGIAGLAATAAKLLVPSTGGRARTASEQSRSRYTPQPTP